MIWFSDLEKSLDLTEEQIKELGSCFCALLKSNKDAQENISKSLSQDKQPRIIFISIATSEHPKAITYVGKGIGIIHAFKDGLSKFPKLDVGGSRAFVKIDIAKEIKTLGVLKFKSKIMIDKGIHGIAFSGKSELALLPEQITGYNIINNENEIDSNQLYNSIDYDPILSAHYTVQKKKKESKFYIFKTISFLIDEKNLNEKTVIPLFRGKRIIDTVNADELKYRLHLSAIYLTRHIYSNGRYDYLFRPDQNTSSTKYNILRHAGTTYALCEYHQIFPNDEILAAIKKSTQYMLQLMVPWGVEGHESICLIENGYIKLGGQALSAIALVKYIEITGDNTLIPVLTKLGNFIISKIQKSGQFKPHKEFYLKDFKANDFVSEYYPGEAILALNRIYSLNKDPKWIDAAEKAALWLITVRDKNVLQLDLLHDHWFLYSLNELYRNRKNPIFIEHTIKICKAIIDKQITDGIYPDWNGGFYNPPSSTPAAIRGEGLSAAYALLKDYSTDKEITNKILDCYNKIILFQFRTQFLPEYAMYFLEPIEVLGGIHASFTNPNIRIDFVQHGMSSMLGFYRIISFKDF